MTLTDRLWRAILAASVLAACMSATTVASPDDFPRAQFGATFITPANPRAHPVDVADVPERIVMIIHGLDDPGRIFGDLIPELRRRGYPVVRFEYPNDGPIDESAALLIDSLRELREAGVEQVDIVAHSMGGLVSRDALTREDGYDGDGTGGDQLPAVDRLIMVGTPNCGSVCARLRVLGEIQEQVMRRFYGERTRRRARDDGSGEAGRDLLPESEFLSDLNARPLPTHTSHTIIAARMSSIDDEKVEQVAKKVSRFGNFDSAPRWWQKLMNKTVAEQIPKLIEDASGALGDGVVTLNSANLQGVRDFVIVQGNHMSMLYKPGDDHKPPPSFAIIFDRLARTNPSVSAGR